MLLTIEQALHSILSSILEWSGILTFTTLFAWTFLRFTLFVYDKFSDTETEATKFFPVSAQKLGFAQAIGKKSLIISEVEYNKRKQNISWWRTLIKVWCPLVAWLFVAQFVTLYGAIGLSNESGLNLVYALLLTVFAFGVLGVYKKSMFKEQFNANSIAEGDPLDWDDSAYIGGMRIKARFEGRPRKIVLVRTENNVLSKNRGTTYEYGGILSTPEAVHQHGTGLLVSEFRMTTPEKEQMSSENWLQQIQLKDVIHSVLNAYVAGKSLNMSVCALLEYPGAVIQISPLEEHMQYFESVGDRLRNRKNLTSISVRDIALAASQEFYTRFDEKKVSALLAHEKWIDRDQMPI